MGGDEVESREAEGVEEEAARGIVWDRDWVPVDASLLEADLEGPSSAVT